MLAKPVFHSAAIGLIQHADQLLVACQHYRLRTADVLDRRITPVCRMTRSRRSCRPPSDYAVSIEAVSDKRFDFTAPHHVTMAVIPQDIYLYLLLQVQFTAATSRSAGLDLAAGRRSAPALRHQKTAHKVISAPELWHTMSKFGIGSLTCCQYQLLDSQTMRGYSIDYADAFFFDGKRAM